MLVVSLISKKTHTITARSVKITPTTIQSGTRIGAFSAEMYVPQ
jgi:hypothetical protein